MSKISLVVKSEKRPSMPASLRFSDNYKSKVSVIPELHIRELVGVSDYQSFIQNRPHQSLSSERQNNISSNVGSLLNLKRKQYGFMLANDGNELPFNSKFPMFKTNDSNILGLRQKIKSMRNEKFANQLLLTSNDSVKKPI